MLRSTASPWRIAGLGGLLSVALMAVACSGAYGETAAPATAGEGGSLGDGESEGGDTIPPTVLSNEPPDAATRVANTTAIRATFSEAMAPLTLTSLTFRLAQGAVTIPGTVTYFDRSATFAPASELALGTTYTATITTAAEDLAGNALASAHTWTFTTDATAPLGPAPVLLGLAGKYVILASDAIANTPTSVVGGDVGISPAGSSSITGFVLNDAGTKWTSSQVLGGVFTADNAPPTPSNLTLAVADMAKAYSDAAGRPTPTFVELGGGAIGGLMLTPGLYAWSSAVSVAANVTISGGPNDVWIFQIKNSLTMSAGTVMTLSGGARSKNIVWVAGSVTAGSGSHAEGIVLSKTSILLGSGASINGRLLAQTTVDLLSATATAP